MQSPHSFGLEWTPELDEPLRKQIDLFSAVEIIPENFFEGRFADFLHLLRDKQTPVAVHGVLLSLGSAEPLKVEHLERVFKLVEGLNVKNYSEHLSMTEVGGVEFDALTPLPWTKEQLELVCRKIEQIQERIPVPFLIENVANRFVIADSDYPEPEFINAVIQKTGCGLLLDVTNVYTNSVNFNFDPADWLKRVDLKATQVIHLAGGFPDPDGFLMDSHDNRVPETVWTLYEKVREQLDRSMTIIERTGNLPDFDDLVAEIERAKSYGQRSPFPRDSIEVRL